MATVEQIAELRLMINQPANVDPWTDDVLGDMIDAASDDLSVAAGKVWRAKAASVAHLVDISEGGSSRKMSDLYKNFIAIAEGYETGGTGAVVETRRPAMTRAITRV